MAEGKAPSGNAGEFWRGLLMLGLVVAAILTPLQMIQRAIDQGRESVAWIIGEDYENELYEWANGLVQSAGAANTDVRIDGVPAQEQVGAFLESRVATAEAWGVLALYRGYVTFAWLVAFAPFVAASIIDAWSVREIRKQCFIAQSPLRHKKAVQLSLFGVVFIPLSVFIPIHISPLVIPCFIGVWCWAAWTWIVHLQKRI